MLTLFIGIKHVVIISILLAPLFVDPTNGSFFFFPCNLKNALNLCCHNLCRVGQIRGKKLENYVREELICSLARNYCTILLTYRHHTCLLYMAELDW